MLVSVKRLSRLIVALFAMFFQLGCIFLSLIVVLVVRFFNLTSTRHKIHGVYSQPTAFYWPKYFLMRWLIEREQKKRAKSKEVFNGDMLHMSRKDKQKKYNIELMEKKQILTDDLPYAGDCIFFNGANKNGDYLAFGFAQRQNNIANVFFMLKIANVGTFVNEELLRSSNVETIPDAKAYKTKSGFEVRCLEPMKVWHIKFDGNLVDSSALKQNLKQMGEDIGDETAKRYHCKLDWTWRAIGDHFNFDTDISPNLIAQALALEPWSRELFERLQASHQTHYEQFGDLSGKLQIDDNFYDFKITSMRDHTIAPYRRWIDLRRYIMISFHLEDGTCINSMAVSMPGVVFTHLNFGYVIKPDGSKLPVKRLNLHLPYLGENKQFPDQFEYDFDVGETSEYMTVQVNVRQRIALKMGLDLGCYIEQLTCEFNVCGKKGYGLCEVEYRIEPY